MTASYNQIIEQAWNAQFQTVFSSKETSFHIISSNIDVTYYNSCYRPEDRKRHLIFYDCSLVTLLQASNELTLTDDEKNEKVEDFNTVVQRLFNHEGVVESVAFVQCDFGKDVIDLEILLSMWLTMPNLKAVSFSKCNLPNSLRGDFFRDSAKFAKLKRFEVQTTCMNVSIAKLFMVLDSVIAIGQRHVCECSGRSRQNGGWKGHSFPDMVPVFQSKNRPPLEEVEFDMNRLSLEDLSICFQEISKSPRLSMISLNLKELSNQAVDMHDTFFQTVKRLKAVEIKGVGYFPPMEKDLVSSNILELLFPHRRYLQHISINDVKSDCISRKICLASSLDQFKSLESIRISNSNIFDISESLSEFLWINHQDTKKLVYTSKKFGEAELPHLLGFELKGANDLEWKFLLDLVHHVPLLVKLDISGLNRRTLPGENDLMPGTGYHPLCSVFNLLTRLRELSMDDLEIGDKILFRGINNENFARWRKENSEPISLIGPNLANLQNLRKLSIQNTDVTDLTVRCIGDFMPNVTHLNVSFTEVTESGIEHARKNNPLLEVITIGCRISQSLQSKFRNPEWLLVEQQIETEIVTN